MTWITENLGSIVIVLLLVAMVAGIVWKLRRDKRRGVSTCGCNCSSCPGNCSCHKET